MVFESWGRSLDQSAGLANASDDRLRGPSWALVAFLKRASLWPLACAARLAALTAVILLMTGCQAGYLLRSAWSQADLLLSRTPIEKIMNSPETDRAQNPEELRKLKLALEAKEFAEKHLGLKKTKNYTSFVQLDRPYVSYIVSAAKRDALEFHRWWFPIVGHVPYKGYFNPEHAKSEAREMEKEGYDTYVRGASAYSTLGWFNDPVLSSMLRYSDYDLVNLIIHETVHATIYIKSEADFNERLATFLGDLGAELFFKSKEGDQSPTLQAAENDRSDENTFSNFISREIDDLRKWYESEPNKTSSDFLARRKLRFQKILQAFDEKVAGEIKNARYRDRLRRDLAPDVLNNASLLSWKLYVYDLSDFRQAFDKLGRDPIRFLEFAKSLEKEASPETRLKEFIR